MFETSKQRMANAELASKKMENDKGNYDFESASSFHLIKREYERTEAVLKSLTKGTKEWNKQNKHLKGVTKQWREAIVELKKDKVLYNASTGKFTNDAISTKGLLTDENGSFVGDDIRKAKTLGSVFGGLPMNDRMQDMFDSRVRKRLSIIIKEEYATEAGKRIHIESFRRGNKKFRDKFLQIAGNRIKLVDNDTKDAMAAVHNALTMSVMDENNPEAMRDFVKLFADSYETAGDEEEKSKALVNITDLTKKASTQMLAQSENMKEAMMAAAAESIADFNEKGADGKDKYSAEEKTQKINTALENETDDTFRKQVSKHLITKLSGILNQNEESLRSLLNVSVSNNGRIDLGFNEGADKDQIVKLFSESGSRMADWDRRDRREGRAAGTAALWAAIKVAMPDRKELGTHFEDELKEIMADMGIDFDD
jgi:hypothetical protein